MFINPTMLAGIAGAVVPLVLHLLGRARFRNVEWGAMMFLGVDDPRQYRNSRLKELTLLLLRMGLVSLLAIALSRPVLWSRGVDPQSQPACVVIVLDRSASMDLDENGLARREVARRAALSVLSNLRRGDEAAVILMPDSAPAPAQAGQLTTDLQSLGFMINGLRSVPGGRADVAAGLGAAARLLKSARAANRQVILISDRQALSWQGVNEAFARAWRQSLLDRPADQPPHVAMIPIGGDETGNIAIESVQIVNPPVVRDAPTEVEVGVRSFDSIPRAGLSLVARAGEEQLYQTSLAVPAGQTVTARFAVKFATSGSQVMRVQLNSTGLEQDNTMDCAVNVTDAINVLVISGDQRSDPGSSAAADRNAADFLRLALSPFHSAGQPGPDPARAQIVAWENWPLLDRAKYRVVVLANVPRLSAVQSRQLEQYVYGGGGLLVAPGNLSRAEDYNAQLWRDGAGLLPAGLETLANPEGAQPTALLGLDLSHPIFHFLQGRQDPLPRVTIGRYFSIHGDEPRGKVLGQYTSGQPFMVEDVYGRGRVILLTTALDADWSTLPYSNFYLPFVQSTVRYLAAGMVADRNLAPGQPIAQEIEGIPNLRVTIDGPGIGRNYLLEPLRSGEGYEARFTNTLRPGTYTLRIGSLLDPAGQQARELRQVHFVVNPPREESDLANLSQDRFGAMSRALGASVLATDPPAIAAAISELRRRWEIWPILLPAVIALAILEIALARAWNADAGEPRRAGVSQ